MTTVTAPPSGTSSRRKRRLAIALWLTFAFVAWNALFDFLIVRSGRDYLHAAVIAQREGRPNLLIADWMRPAVARAFTYASVLGVTIAVCGVAAVIYASRRR